MFPEGLDTHVRERGSRLSAGERQLVSLVRAALVDPAVIVLDEATSNLDLKSEALIEEALDVLLEGRTAILIAHRLATAMRADRIAVIHDGQVVELGTHADLVMQGGRYAAMVATATAGGAVVALLPWRRLFEAGWGVRFLYAWSITDIVLVTVCRVVPIMSAISWCVSGIFRNISLPTRVP